MEQEVINTYDNLFHFTGHNNDLLFLKQWKGAVITEPSQNMLHAQSIFLTHLLQEILQKIVF